MQQITIGLGIIKTVQNNKAGARFLMPEGFLMGKLQQYHCFGTINIHQ